MTLSASEFFRHANFIECAVWIVIAVTIAFRFGFSRLTITAVISLVLFGISDILEAQSGAWWRPWWLLAWKAGCVVLFLGCAWVGYQHRSRRHS